MNRLLSPVLGLVLVFAALAKGAHDLWAATLVTLSGLFLLVFWVYQAQKDENSDGIPVFYLIPTLFLIGAMGASYSDAVHPQESHLELVDWLLALVFFWVGLAAFQTKDAVRTLLMIMVPVFWIQLIVNTFHLISQPGLSVKSVPATLINPNIAAGFFLFWIPPLLDAIRTPSGGHPLWRRFWILGLVACVINLVLTGSVSAWLCLLLFLPILLGWDRVKSFKKRRPGFTKGLLFIVVLFVGVLVYQKWMEVMGPSATGTSRFIWWKAGLNMFLDRPLFGIGLGNYTSAYLAYQVGQGQHTLYPHNMFLGWLAETGLMGMAALLAFFGAWLFVLIRFWEPLSERRAYVKGILLFLFFGSMNLGWEYLINLLILFTFMAISISPAIQHRWRPRLSMVIVVAGVSFLLIPFVASPFLASQDVVMGQAQLKQGNRNEARSSFMSAIDLDPLSWEAHQGLAAISFEEGKRDESIEQQKKAISLHQLNGMLYWELGRYYYEAKQWKDAYAAFKKAVELHKTNKLFQDTLNGAKKEIFGG